MLAILDQDIVVSHHDDDNRFNQTTPDVEWLRAIGAEQQPPIVISGDSGILRKPVEVNTLRELGLTFFVMTERFEEMSAYDQAWKFFKIWPDVRRECKRLHEPSVFKVMAGKSQKVEFYRLTKNLPHK
jgi:hypothetical protein